MASVVSRQNEDENRKGIGASGGGVGGGPRLAAAPPPATSSTTGPITCSAHITEYWEPEDYSLLLAGVDSLDLGIYVKWDFQRIRLMDSLLTAKKAASGTKGMAWNDCRLGKCIIHPSAGKPTYRVHLETPEFHAWLFSTLKRESTPNAYISLRASSLWRGVTEAVEHVREWIEAHGGTISKVQASRVDLCADFHIPGGLSLPWLLNHKTPGSMEVTPIIPGRSLETFYVGGRKSPIRGRLYDKSKEVKVHRKEWFHELWGIDNPTDVWRIEFQLRRAALRSFEVDTMEDLQRKLGGMWKYLTSDWFSLRARDNKNTSRRSILPFWQAVQEVASQFGPSVDVKRTLATTSPASAMWYVNRAAAFLAGYAAPMGYQDFELALSGFADCFRDYWGDDKHDWATAYMQKRIAAGLPMSDGEEACDVPF
jgi:hypothetical protein